jgi:hypothetical protein
LVESAAFFAGAPFDADGAAFDGSPLDGDDMLIIDAITLIAVSKHNPAMSLRDIC